MCSRRLGDGSSRDSSDDFSELNRAQTQAISMSQTLLVEIRQAVNEAQPKGKLINFEIIFNFEKKNTNKTFAFILPF